MEHFFYLKSYYNGKEQPFTGVIYKDKKCVLAIIDELEKQAPLYNDICTYEVGECFLSAWEA